MSTTILCNVLLDSWHGLDYCSPSSLLLFPGPFFGRAEPLGHVGQLPNVCSPGGLGQLQVVTHWPGWPVNRCGDDSRSSGLERILM